jgi:dihydroorotate dehydrogenase
MAIGEIQFESPLMNAGGLLKTVADVEMMARTAVGAVLAGSFTLDGRVGNSPGGETVYYHDYKAQVSYNSLGMPNAGARELAASGELQQMVNIAHDLGKPFIFNFAPVSGDPVDEVITLGGILSKYEIEGIDAIELNASCPNVITKDGGRHELLSHHPELLEEVLAELCDIAANEVPLKALITRVSPFRDKTDAIALARVLERTGIDAVSAFNTFPGGRPLNQEGEPILQVRGGVGVPDGTGGQSGLGMSAATEEQTQWLIDARTEVEGAFDIIGSNGIGSGETMKRRIDMGAVAVSATTLFWESASWGEAASRILEVYAELGGV